VALVIDPFLEFVFGHDPAAPHLGAWSLARSHQFTHVVGAASDPACGFVVVDVHELLTIYLRVALKRAYASAAAASISLGCFAHW
jgi:hypothetical protein